MHELVHVDGGESHQREVQADQRHEGRHHDRGPAIGERGRPHVQLHLDPQPHREQHEQGAGRHDRAVEHVAREHGEGAQAAEVQVPPERIGGRRDGSQDAERENAAGRHHQLDRRHSRREHGEPDGARGDR